MTCSTSCCLCDTFVDQRNVCMYWNIKYYRYVDSICLWEVPASRLGRNSGYPQALHGYRQFIQANLNKANISFLTRSNSLLTVLTWYRFSLCVLMNWPQVLPRLKICNKSVRVRIRLHNTVTSSSYQAVNIQRLHCADNWLLMYLESNSCLLLFIIRNTKHNEWAKFNFVRLKERGAPSC